MADVQLQQREDDRPWLRPSGLEVPALQIIMAANQPVILWGPPGEGKSATIETLAELQNAHLEVLIGSQYSPTDIAGMAHVVGDRVEHIPPSWASRVVERGETPSIIFFDELDKCTQPVQNACLRAIRERVVGHTHLPRSCRIVAAANPPHLGGWDLSAPMANRLVHLQWQLDMDSVLDGLASGMWPLLTNLVYDESLRTRHMNKWRGIVAGFLQHRQDLVRHLPASEQTQGKPWPSPRSWETMASVMSVADSVGVADNLTKILIVGCVGQEVFMTMQPWLEPIRHLDPEAILAAVDTYPLPEAASHLSVVIAATAAAVVSVPTQPRVDTALRLYERIYREGHKDLVQQGPRILSKLLQRHPELHM